MGSGKSYGYSLSVACRRVGEGVEQRRTIVNNFFLGWARTGPGD